jgi:hypothetical protein
MGRTRPTNCGQQLYVHGNRVIFSLWEDFLTVNFMTEKKQPAQEIALAFLFYDFISELLLVAAKKSTFHGGGLRFSVF